MSDHREHIRSRTLVADSGCWLWQGAITSAGYGTTAVEGRTRGAHRVAYEAFVGPIPPGLQIDHLCRVRHCVNPDHLEPVTSLENTLRGALNVYATGYCKSGHDVREVGLVPAGRHMRCKTCKRASATRAREKRRAAKENNRVA